MEDDGRSIRLADTRGADASPARVSEDPDERERFLFDAQDGSDNSDEDDEQEREERERRRNALGVMGNTVARRSRIDVDDAEDLAEGVGFDGAPHGAKKGGDLSAKAGIILVRYVRLFGRKEKKNSVLIGVV
jgi:hypothetical protein